MALKTSFFILNRPNCCSESYITQGSTEIWLAVDSWWLQKVKLWTSFLGHPHTLAELSWSLSSGYNKIPSALLIKCDMLLKVWVSHEMDREGKGMELGGEQRPPNFLPQIWKLKVNPWNLGLACGDGWGWWRWDGGYQSRWFCWASQWHRYPHR